METVLTVVIPFVVGALGVRLNQRHRAGDF
ncbi:hypothetical protein A3Q40_00166 [Rhodococcus sp. PBTS 1]|nr:hypothetical protein A3Q40_00166 [Rhodococcus sp. PBTS 1]